MGKLSSPVRWGAHRKGLQPQYLAGCLPYNIRRKYLGYGPVVGVMAPPTGMRFRSHSRVARSLRDGYVPHDAGEKPLWL
jgi:hypothetical protein